MSKVFTHLPSYYEPAIMEVTEDDSGRKYNSPIGKLPSVTTVMGHRKKEFFAEWRKDPRNQANLDRSLVRGAYLHSAAENLLCNRDVEYSVPYSWHWKVLQRAIEVHIDNIHSLEAPLWSKLLGLAGRLDCVAEFDGVLSIIDFKGANAARSEEMILGYFLQTTAYSLMWEERTGQAIDQIVIMMIDDDCNLKIWKKNPLDYIEGLYEEIKYYHSVVK